VSGACVRSPWQLPLAPGAPLPDAKPYTISHQPLGFSLSPGDPVTVSWPDRGRMIHGTVIESTDDHTTIQLPEDATEYADDDVQLMAIARERLRAGLARNSSISSQTVRRDDEGGCNACSGGSYETVTLVELRSIGFRLCDECRKTLVEQLATPYAIAAV